MELEFGADKYDFIYNSIRYHIVSKSDITYVISHNYAKAKVDSYNSLHLGKTLTFHCFIKLMKPVFNREMKITTTTKYFQKTVRMNYPKITIANKFLYTL